MGAFDHTYEIPGPHPWDRLPADFGESFSWEAGFITREGTSISEINARAEKSKQRAEQIFKITSDRRLYDQLRYSPGDPLLRPIIKDFANRYTEIKTDEQLFAEIKAENRRYREQMAEETEYKTLGGHVGGFLGAMVASLQDPLILMTMFMGASAGSTILRRAAIEAGINLASEVGIQAALIPYKKRLESEYSADQVGLQLAAAAALGGLFGAGAATLSRLKARGATRKIVEDAARIVDEVGDTLHTNPFPPDPAFIEAHIKATGKALADIDAGRPVDVRPILDDAARAARAEPTEIFSPEELAAQKAALKALVLTPEQLKAQAGIEPRPVVEQTVAGKQGVFSPEMAAREVPDAGLQAKARQTGELTPLERATIEERQFELGQEATKPRVVTARDVPREEWLEMARGKAEFEGRNVKKAVTAAGKEWDKVHADAEASVIPLRKDIDGISAREVNAAKRIVPSLNQKLSLWLRAQGGISIEKSGALRGEAEIAFNDGGGKIGAVKKKAGRSLDELAQAAHEDGFIDEPDPALLLEKLGNDLRGKSVYSQAGDVFENRLDRQYERESIAWVEEQAKKEIADIEARVKSVLDENPDAMIEFSRHLEDGDYKISGKAKAILEQIEDDIKQAESIRACLIATGGKGGA